MNKFISSKALHFFLIILLPLLFINLVDVPFPLTFSLFTSILILWITELIPLGVTALLVPCLAILYGLQNPSVAFSSFGSSIIFLFIGVFFLAHALNKTGLAKRLICYFLSKISYIDNPKKLVITISIAAWFSSMWMSNTAACAILIPLSLGLCEVVEKYFTSYKDVNNFYTRMILNCAFASTVGGIATPIGTPPNLIAIEYFSKLGIEINFLKWFLIAMPLSILMLIVLYFILDIVFPITKVNFENLNMHINSELIVLGKLRKDELVAGFSFFIAITFWIVPSILTTIFSDIQSFRFLSKTLSIEVVAILAAALLFTLPCKEDGRPLLSKTDFSHIDWNTIFLFGGGLTLGTIISSSGAALAIGNTLASTFSSSWIILIIAFCGLSVLASEFSSNTASAAIVIPISLGITQFETIQLQCILAIVFSCSYGFMLPISTAPNALAYATGKLKLKNMIKAGIVFDLLGILLIVIFMFLILPIFGIF